MAELHAQRVSSTGEAGIGYVLDDGYDMPPLMLTPDELEAAALGAAWVASEADPSLARTGRDLVSKLSSAIPTELRPAVLDGSSKPIQTPAKVSERYRLPIIHTDRDGKTFDRIVCPLLIAFLDRTSYLVGWCETKEVYRHFKTERVEKLRVLAQKYPERRQAQLKGWEEATTRRMRG